MFKLLYWEMASIKIENFVHSYKKWFLQLYFDTWIESELEILKNYEILWDKFYDMIKIWIKSKFTEEKIFWISQTESWKQYTTVSINNFRLFIYYTEIKKENLRIINDIEIFKK